MLFLFERENTVSTEQRYEKSFPQNEASVKRNMTERYVTENDDRRVISSKRIRGSCKRIKILL